ncbi:MAG TPA: xanthine dehydrogenase family protein molybdopterin-binding subunit [Burkholderiales bacterium]|jgi:carbon-monoxide dehydrogenase large subunit|nr:xanthine dehydrogenase family protein molybdopterin-binding subunit [Burkholderiales bacterium]
MDQRSGRRLAPSRIGVGTPRSHARRLAAGRGRYADDLRFPRLLHAAFVRSPHAHARIGRIDFGQALALKGVIAAFDGPGLARVCKPWQTKLETWPGHRSAPQWPLAMERALWQGEPVAIVLAESRALAEDGAERVEVEWEPLAALATPEAALEAQAPLLHPELGTNLAFEHRLASGGRPSAAGATQRIARRLKFSRHTGVPLEPRSIVADFDASQRHLTVYQATQVPHQMRAAIAECLGLQEHEVRLLTPDVGGGFGVKLHVYGDELAACAASVLTGRAVKYVCDRLEAFSADIHARAHRVDVAVELSADGRIGALAVDDVMEAGAYSAYPRSSILEGLHVLFFAGAPYDIAAREARLRVVWQNKPATGSYRGVGQPIACGAVEPVIDAAARALGMDPAEIRRINYRGEGFTHEACLDRLLDLMDYKGLRSRQAAERERGCYLGVGFAAFMEQNAPGPTAYGDARVKISAQEGCTLRLEPSGTVTCVSSHADQGQGVETALGQLVAETLELPLEHVRVVGGDSAMTAVGRGTFASGGLTIAGEAVLLAARRLAERLVQLAAALWNAPPATLELSGAAVREIDGTRSIPIAELAALMNYRQHQLPSGIEADPAVTVHASMKSPYLLANGIQASLVRVDPDTGMVKLLKHWIVEDCGRVVNPLLADEQLRGGIVQGIGAALFEQSLYDEDGQLLNASMADYLVPMAGEMPDIEIAHVESAVAGTLLGAKGIGEAGTIGAAAAVGNAINDALAPFGVEVTEQPYTPQRILQALAGAR